MSRASNFKDLTGQRVGKWTVISFLETRGKQPFWSCRCDCGVEKVVGSNSLRNGSKSCGCLKLENQGRPRVGKSEEDLTLTSVQARYRCEAERRGYAYELTYEQFVVLVTGNCFYCNKSREESSFQTSKRGTKIRYNGIDRVDNAKGYIVGNVVTCCKECNTLKRAIPLWMVKKILCFVEGN